MPQFKTTLKKSDFQEGKLMKSEIGGKPIVIGMVEDKLAKDHRRQNSFRYLNKLSEVLISRLYES